MNNRRSDPASPWGRAVLFTIKSTCKGGGYRYCRTTPRHPKANAKGLYPLHRVLVENRIGRLLERGEDVHHVDGNKDNNDPGNLTIMSHREHARLHRQQASGHPVKLKCFNCKREIVLKPHQARQRLSRSVNGKVCCSYRCSRLSRRRPKGSSEQ